MELMLIDDILIILALSIVVLLIVHKFRVPTIVGFLFTGVLAGPHGFRLIKAVHEVEILAEIGIVFLLFTIGIHFSIEKLLQMKKVALIGGVLQVLATIFASFAIAGMAGLGFAESMFLGWLLALSSTAIVLKLLQERAEIESPHGRNSVAILIFQDIIIFPMILFVPLLAGASGSVGETVVLLAAKALGMIIFVFIGAKYIVPTILYQVVKTRSRELFLLAIVVICFAVAWLTSYVGLSLSLGAFLAGLIISESEYSHQAMGNILPFRDLFLSLFFISVGMLLDVSVLFKQPVMIFLLVVGVLVLKSGIAAFAIFTLGFPLRTCLIVGLTLSQVGEFSFILSKSGLEYGLLPGDSYQTFLAVSIITMVATPFMISFAPRLADLVVSLPLPERMKSGLYRAKTDELKGRGADLKDHLIIIGYGVNGKNVARAARKCTIPYVIIEMNPETVRTERARSQSIFYGDATDPAVLEHANIKHARVLVIAIADAAATRRITQTCKADYPHVHIVARTRFLHEMKPLYELGADEVIPEEFETSVEIFTRVMRKYLVPGDEIESFISEIRSEGYQIFRSPAGPSISIADLELHISDNEIRTFRVLENSPLVGKTLEEMALRKKYEITVLLVSRDSENFSNPRADIKLQANDLITVLGKPDKVAGVATLLKKSV